MKLKRWSALMVACIFMVATFSLGGCSEKEETPPAQSTTPPATTEFFNIATGGTSGTYYPLGGALAAIMNSNVANVNATAQTTGASVSNVNSLNTDESQIAFIQNDIAFYAYDGSEMFVDNKVSTLKGISTLYPETCQLVTLKSSGITSIEDLKGKKISVGAAGSGTEANARQILAANGITYDDISVQYLSFGESSQGLKDGNIDAALVTAGHPTAAITELATTNDAVIIAITDVTADALIADYPFYTKVVIPADTYKGQTEDVQTVAVMAMLAVTDSMSEDMAYNITKALYSNLDNMKNTHAAAADMSADTAKEGMSIPMHPGAEKYFNEIEAAK